MILVSDVSTIETRMESDIHDRLVMLSLSGSKVNPNRLMLDECW